MKKITIILLLFTAFKVSAQKYNPPKGWKSPELFLPASVLISTFTINHNIYDVKTRNQIAITGILTSVATHFIFRTIRNNNKNCKFTFKHINHGTNKTKTKTT